MKRIALVLLVTACAAGAHKMASAPMSAPMPNAPPPPLERSLFARDPNGQLSEDALQKILASPIELDLPSRVGVLPIITAHDWRGPGPDIDHVPPGVGPLVTRLRRDPAFSLVTEMMPIPSGALGMEALRESAARYRLRYIVLYREVLATEQRANAWAIGYATIIGTLLFPGNQHEVYGYIEASMFDVKTGLLMFTTRRSVVASQQTNAWYSGDKLKKLAAKTTSRFAPDLATDMLVDVRRFAAAAVVENAKHGVPPEPIVAVPPPMPVPAIAD